MQFAVERGALTLAMSCTPTIVPCSREAPQKTG
jgi:hypothetical protein